MNPRIDAHITFLRVRDLGRSHEFYAGALGLPLALDQGRCRIYRLTDTSFVGLCAADEPPASDTIVTIVTPDVHGWYERMVAAGVPVDGPPRDNPAYRIHHFWATDPDGHSIEVQRFHDPGWAGGTH